MKKFLHKLKHWEYWPMYIVYLPSFFLWLWYMLKFRSLSFYKKVNPVMTNGGFYGDSKMEIYALLPRNTYPKTIELKNADRHRIINIIHKHDLLYPLIFKPAIGLRGIAVQKVENENEAVSYLVSNKFDILIQEFIQYPNEMGVFYVRMPNEDYGIITGITLKAFLNITGDGEKSILQILQETPRYAMQIKKLKHLYNLEQVLAKGEEICLVPYGNHNRGTAFYDGKHYITEKLEKVMNNILAGIDGFHYGRLDIRYNSFEELEEGKKFSIIEINGVKSEPTHIYDPKHSFWFGQIEIYRHQKMMARVLSNY